MDSIEIKRKRDSYRIMTELPGDFKGQPIYMPHFYNVLTDGGEFTFNISAEDYELFPELRGKTKVTIRIVDGQFISGEVW